MEDKQAKKIIRNFFQRDHSYTIYFLFVAVIYILVITKNTNSYTLAIIFLLLNGVIGIQQHILPQQRVIVYQKVCLFASKLSIILLILLIDHELAILILVAFERLDQVQSNRNNIKKFDNLILRFITLCAMFFDYNQFVTLSILYSIMIEINRLILENQWFEKQKEETFAGLLTQVENHWTSRLQIVPSCYIIINSETQTITYKNNSTFKFFSLCYANESELDEILLTKLQFRLVKEKIEQIKSFSKQDKNKKTTGKLNKWQFKRDSVSMQFSPATNCDQLKQHDSLDFINSQGFTLKEIIQKKKFSQFRALMSPNFVELFCDQSWSTLEPQFNYSFTLKKIQLFGQIVDNTKENEIIVVLKDMSRYNELQQLISNDEFKSKIIESFSHELRTPLNSAINFLTSAIQDDGNFEDVKEDLLIPAIHSLKMQSYFINDIIDLSQIYVNKFKISYSEFTLRELITEITNIFKIQFEMKGLEFCVDLIENSATILVADYTRLVQILVNLIQNSLKFSMDGIIFLKISSCQNNILKFSVSDEGFGISRDHLDQLQFLLINIDQEKDIQINHNWQGFGLLISAILVSRLAPPDNRTIQMHSDGANKGTEVSFYLENHINKVNCLRQATIRQSISRFQSSNEDSLKLDINGLIYQATEQHLSKQYISEYSYMKNSIFRQKLSPVKQISNENLQENREDENSCEALHFKYLQLSPLSPSLMTDKLFQFPNEKQRQSLEYSKRQSFRKIALAEVQLEEDFLNTYQKKKKCNCQNILSVDDEIFNQRSIQILLSKLGFNVILAFNGEQAIKKLLEIQPCSPKCQYITIILMDYQMPIMDGPTTTKRMVEMMNLGLIPKVHIIGLTAFTSSQDVDACIKAGMSDVLAKPLNLRSLREILTLIF